jgi:putative transposase
MSKRFLGFLCEADMGVPVRQLCDTHGFSESSYYRWRARIVAGRRSLAQRLADLENENSQLKRLLGDNVLAFGRAAEEPLQWPELLPLPEPTTAGMTH